MWYAEPLAPDEVAFEADVFLLTKAKAAALRTSLEPPAPQPRPGPDPGRGADPALDPDPKPQLDPEPAVRAADTVLRLTGNVPPEVWNRLGTKLLPKLRSGTDLSVSVDLSVRVDSRSARAMEADLRQTLADLGLTDRVRVEV